MPKNAVQKLQEIQKDINTVISLYEIANKKKNNNDKSETSKKQDSKQFPQISTSKYLEAIPQLDKFREESGKPQVSLLDTFKKASSFFTRPSQGLGQGLGEPLLKVKWKTNKPGSAPSFSSEISTTVESDYVRQELSDTGTASDKEILGKTKTSDSLDSSDWLGNNVLPAFELVMTPSKTLETAKKVLEKNNFKVDEESEETEGVVGCAEKKSEKNFENETAHQSLHVKKSSTSQIKNQKKRNRPLGRSRSTSPKEAISVPRFESNLPTSKSVVTAQADNAKDKSLVDIRSTVDIASKEGKEIAQADNAKDKSLMDILSTVDFIFKEEKKMAQADIAKDKSLMDILSTVDLVYKEEKKMAQVDKVKNKSFMDILSTVAFASKEEKKTEQVDNAKDKSPADIRSTVAFASKEEKKTAQVDNVKDKSPVDIRSTVAFPSKEEKKTERKPSNSEYPKNVKSSKHKTKQDDGPSDNNQPSKDAIKSSESKMTLPEKKSPILKRAETSFHDKLERKKSRGNFETKTVQFSEVEKLPTNQKEKPERQDDDVESLANEFSKIFGKTNEKLHKMKVSTELALNIANHFKKKYDEIQKSKGELLGKLQMVEKNNERLSNEIQEARESTKMLQKKIQELEEHSIQEAERTGQLKDLREEIENLKTTLQETEKQYKAQILEKNKTIEEIQTNRLEESKNGLKQQELLAKKLQRLTKEKCELLSKFEELGRQLQKSHSKTKILQENIRQLEEEVQKEKQHLKIKTETLHETNRELEMIRLNCTDLEDQVKILRKSIEEFDGIQHSLIKQTTEYEQQIKSNQEKIRDLQNENIRLQGELENEKDGLRIKTKIIEDQQQTIRQLKDKSEDSKTLLRKNQSLERLLNTEREEKLELQEAVQRLKWRKEELKKKVKSLENDFLLAPQEVVRDLQKTQVVLHELENQVQTKQREWELQMQTLIREKEQACSVAEFATKKLMETTNEFQKQAQAYKGLQRLVAGNLAAKERHHLREGNKKVG